MTVNIAVGIVVTIVVIILMLKRYESRMVLIGAGVLMAIVGMKPMAAFDAFAKSMTNAGLITAVCSTMGFAMVMKFTGCDKHLVSAIANVLKKVSFLLIPGTVIATFIVNISLPSAAGVSAAVGVIFIPILMSAGVHPAMAAAAVKSGTFGSMLSPGLVHNGVVAKLANKPITDVIAHHMTMVVAGMLVAAVVLTILAVVIKENKGYVPEEGLIDESFSVNPLYALMPLVPIIILILGATKVPALKMGVAQAMVIGAIVTMLATRTSPAEITKSFFKGMGEGYANIISIIIAVGVFVAGLNALGVIKAIIAWMLNATDLVKYAASFGPFVLAIISGSGDAATVAFNEAITPHAASFGIDTMSLGSIATYGGTLGRTISPIAGATVIVAGIAGVDPMEVCKRNALGITLALIVGIIMMF